jgi:lipase
MKHDPMPQVRTQDIGDANISYLLYDGDGPTLVLMHATGFLPWLWHPIAMHLAPEWRVIAPYFCDHRDSDPEKGGLSWLTVAEDFSRLCSALDLKKPALVGHSMGATVLTLAHTVYKLQALGMILIEPIYLPSELYVMDLDVNQHPLASKSIKRRNGWNDKDDAYAYLSARPLFHKWDPRVLELYVNYGMKEADAGGLQLACSPRREASLFMGGLVHDPWPLLPEISCPTLILEGEDSENRAFIDLKKATSLIPKGSYRLISSAGHLIPMEKPGEVLDIIRDFFHSS